jgi:phosphohistidine phosphatase
LTSPARRAAQTAEVFARELGLAARLVKQIDSLYLAPPDDIAAAIKAIGARLEHLLVVGHNPGLSEFAIALAPNAGIPSFATGASCTFAVESGDWQRLAIGTAPQYDAPGRFFDLWP